MCVRNLISRILSLIYSTNLRLDLEQLQIWQGVGGGRLVVSCQHRRHSCCLTKIDVDEFCCVAVNENILYVTVTQPDHVTNWREKKGRNISRTQLCVYAKLWGSQIITGSGESTSKLLDLLMKADSGQLNDITLKVTTTVILFRFFDFSTSIGQVKVLIVSIVSERSISSWLKAKSYKLPQQVHTPPKD